MKRKAVEVEEEIQGPEISVVSCSCSKRQRISSYSELLVPGDVIFAWRSLGYKHYGVVSKVTPETVMVIHYWAHGAKTEAIIREDPIEVFVGSEGGRAHVLDFTSKVVRMIYGSPLNAQQVVCRAVENLGKKGGSYSVLRNNCEHFAIECKTGRATCWQSKKFKLAGGILFLSSFIYYANVFVYAFL